MDIFSYESARRIWDQNILSKVDALMDWPLVLPLLKSGLNRLGLGPQGYDEIVLFNCLLIGQWHGLSDPKLEESLRVRFNFPPNGLKPPASSRSASANLSLIFSPEF
jgi:IS5 family transposase